jgi:hypothetical protein
MSQISVLREFENHTLQTNASEHVFAFLIAQSKYNVV